MINNNINCLGIDIGGAHLKIIGIDNNGKVIFVDYTTCRIWENVDNLKEKFLKLNKRIPESSIKCAVTMTAELCDNFKDRNCGVKTLLQQCNYLKFDCYFYVKSSNCFSKNPKYDDMMSMNWHSIGKFLENKIDNAIAVDFGSTTTDFVCIKNGKMLNKFFDDFSRLNNHELLYTGFTRTPIMGITNLVKLKNQRFNIIPEFFSDTSDIYRILKYLKKYIDIDSTADKTENNYNNSLRRISRSLGFDYNRNKKEMIKNICIKLSDIQLNKILDCVRKHKNRFSSKKPTIVISGIGQDILFDFLKEKNLKTKCFQSFLKNSQLNKHASYHAPALAIALLLQKLK